MPKKVFRGEQMYIGRILSKGCEFMVFQKIVEF
ncbi:hypothetical protein BA6E_103101 [Bacteroidales bacterium 6E]|nr:hypothetical protein BA6E_103101 [Bacteroidales bacterium 6E]